jgi:hypothetical protein
MSNDPKNLPTYTREEVASILTHALDHQHEGGRISHDELLETAREIGMTTLEVDAAVAAEVKLRAERIMAEELRSRAERLALEEARKRAERGFFLHAVTFAVMSVVMTAIDLRTSGGAWWFYAVGAWALGVAVHAAFTFRRGRAEDVRPQARETPTTAIDVRDGKMKLR